MENTTRRRHSVFFPILLIGVGAALLLRNVGGMHWSTWEFVTRLWPLLLVVMGLDGLLNRDGLAGPLIMLCLGGALLLSTLGVWSWDIWGILGRIWPVIIIAIGLDLIFGRRSLWASIATLALVGIALAAAIWLIGLKTPAVTTEKISQSATGAASAKIAINPGMGALSITTSAESANLIEGDIHLCASSELSKDFSIKNGEAQLRLSSSFGNILPMRSSFQNCSWDLALMPELPVNLDAEVGVGEMRLDLRNLEITALKAHIGLGKMVITLPERGRFRASIEGGMGETEIIIPEGMAYQVQISGGLNERDMPSDVRSDGDTYTSKDFDIAANRVVLEIDQGIGKISIRQPGNSK